MPVPSETAWAQQTGTRTGDRPAQPFDIPSGPLSTVVPLFERATGMKVTIAVDSIGMITSPGVTGTFTPQDALAQLLAGTNVAVRYTSPTAATLELRLAGEAVDVTAAAPAVTVASPKYTQPLRGIPQTVEVIPAAVMTAQGATTLTDALRNVPGITMQAGEGGGASNTSGDMFNMRGFNAANSLFVDGVRDDGLVSRDVFNLEQVEVFMGPTGSDIGRGTAAGYVNMLSKVPHLPALYSGQIGFGSSSQKRVTLDIGAPLSQRKDTWLGKSAFRLNTLWQDNGVPGRQVVQNESKGIAPTVAFGLETPTRVVVAAQLLKQDNVPDYGIPGSAWSEEPLAPTTVRASKPVDQTNYYGTPRYDYDQATQQSYTGRVEHDIRSNLTFRNQARYNDTYRDAVITTIQNPAAFDPKTELVTAGPPGQPAREPDFLEPDQPRGSVQHRHAPPRGDGRTRGTRTSGSGRPPLAASAPGRPSVSIRPIRTTRWRPTTRFEPVPTRGAGPTRSGRTRSTRSTSAADGRRPAACATSDTTRSIARSTRRR